MGRTQSAIDELSSLSLATLLCLLLIGAGQHVHRSSQSSGEFESTMTESIARMHGAMQVPFTGDADRDFARMMIPHHQGAIDMAIAELRHGKDPRMKRLAQEIIVDQQQEIATMHLILGDPLPAGRPAPTQVESDATKEQ